MKVENTSDLKNRQFNCRLAHENYDWLAEQAKRNRRTMTSEFNALLDELRQKDEEQKANQSRK